MCVRHNTMSAAASYKLANNFKRINCTSDWSHQAPRMRRVRLKHRPDRSHLPSNVGRIVNQVQGPCRKFLMKEEDVLGREFFCTSEHVEGNCNKQSIHDLKPLHESVDRSVCESNNYSKE